MLREHRRFIIFTSLLFVAVFAIENFNGRLWLNDLRVYYSASQALLAGKQVYGVAFGLDTGFYKYSPFVLLLFAPYTLFSFYGACVLHYMVMAVSCIGSLLLVRRISGQYMFGAAVSHRWVLPLTLLCFLNHLVRELHLGNVNMLLVFILSGTLLLLLRGKEISAAVLLAIAILFKPYLILLCFPLLLHKKVRVLIFCAGALLLSFLGVFLVTGVSEGVMLHRQWVTAMLAHNNYLGSPHTLFSLLRSHIFTALPEDLNMVFTGMMCLLLFGVMVYARLRSAITQPVQLIFGYFGLLALFPNLFITDTEHFLFVMPLLLICITGLFVLKSRSAAIIFIILVIMYGANSSDLLGEGLSDVIEKWGVLGLANFCIVIFAIVRLRELERENRLLA
jgi:hypothetical protein